MNPLSEKDLDRALEGALRTNAEFASWFLNQTPFAGRSSVCIWSRSDHPWTKCDIEIPSAHGGRPTFVSREGETDILAVYEMPDGNRLGLHIENKREQGQFTPFQPQGYAARAKRWVGNAAYGGYQEWATVLVAPEIVAR